MPAPKNLYALEQQPRFDMKCHEDYIKRTSVHPERDIHTFRRLVYFIERLQDEYERKISCQAHQKP